MVAQKTSLTNAIPKVLDAELHTLDGKYPKHRRKSRPTHPCIVCGKETTYHVNLFDIRNHDPFTRYACPEHMKQAKAKGNVFVLGSDIVAKRKRTE